VYIITIYFTGAIKVPGMAIVNFSMYKSGKWRFAVVIMTCLTDCRFFIQKLLMPKSNLAATLKK